MPKVELLNKLTLFDVTNLVIGAIIGADIYVASSFGAGYLGPFSLVVWILAGVIAIVIALCFAQCVALLPKVGGPYAYSKEAWGPFAGFLVGWSLWLAEWISLAVFPIAFVRYLMFFAPSLDWFSQILAKAAFVGLLAVSNIVGVRAAGRANDVLTLAKLAPLVFFSVVGLIYMVFNAGATAGNFSPFVPLGLSGFGPSLVLIFWAYAGFEISTIPAGEIENPGVTIPRAIILGISIVTVFYLVTNFVLFGLRPWSLLASDGAPLATAITVALGSVSALALVGGTVVGAGALISVAGSDESGMIGTSRLGYALAVDGLFPRSFARIHSRFKTPYMSIIIQSISALAAAIVGNLSLLIATSVFLMAVSYLATSAATFPLRKKNAKPQFSIRGGKLIPFLGALFSLYLITQCTFTQIALGLVALTIGIPIYTFFSPKKELEEVREALFSRESVLRRTYQQESRFLAHLLMHIKRFYRKMTGKKQTWESPG